jgi:hypothetical protein
MGIFHKSGLPFFSPNGVELDAWLAIHEQHPSPIRQPTPEL